MADFEKKEAAESSKNNSEDQKVDNEIKEEIKKLPLKEKIQTLALRSILNEKKKLDAELEAEIKALHQKYDKLSYPLIKKSNEIIMGERAPLQEELKDIESLLVDSEQEQVQSNLVAEPIEKYWLKAMKNCESLAHEIKSKDEEVLQSLTKIEFEKEEGSHNFQLRFFFKQNDFFTNEVLSKRFIMESEEEPLKTEGTEIEWKEGKNITKKTIKKKQKNKKSGQQRTITKEVDEESFFQFFKSIDINEEALKDLDDDEAEQMQERMNIDLDIAQIIEDEFLPYSLEYYLGIKHENEEDYDEEDLDEDEDEEEEEEKPKKVKKHKHKKSDHSDHSDHKHGHGHHKKSDKQSDKKEEKPECKQQ